MARTPRKSRAQDPAPVPPPPQPKPTLASRFDGFDRVVGMGAVWAVVVASTLLNAWGWLQSTAGLIAGVVVALVIAAEILGATLLPQIMRSFDARNVLRGALAAVLFVGCVGFNAASGHRAFEMIEVARVAPEKAKAHADALIVERQRKLDAVQPVQLTDDQGRSIGPQRLEIITKQRDADVARLAAELQAAKDARAKIATTSASSVPPMDANMLWALVLLVEAIKAGALFALARPTQRQAKRKRDAELAVVATPVSAQASPIVEPSPRREPPPRPRLVASALTAEPVSVIVPPEPAPAPEIAPAAAVEPPAPRRFVSAEERLAAMRQQRQAALAPPAPIASMDGPSIRQRGRMSRRAGLDKAARLLTKTGEGEGIA